MDKKFQIWFLMVVLMTSSAFARATDFTLNRYVSSTTYNTNSYWLESETGVALIDAQMLRSDAGKLALLIKSTGKPLDGVIITHAHFDHFSGLSTLREILGDFPVYSTQATVEGIKKNHAATITWAPESYGNDYDMTLVVPNKIVKSGDLINIAGIPMKIDDIGPGESENNLVIFQPDKNILFSGDSTLHSDHYYLGEGRSIQILEQLQYLQKTYADVTRVYTGHGDPATPAAAFTPAIEYVQYVQKIVSKALADGEISEKDQQTYDEEKLQALANNLSEKYPGLGEYGLSFQYIVKANIKAVLKELEN